MSGFRHEGCRVHLQWQSYRQLKCWHETWSNSCNFALGNKGQYRSKHASIAIRETSSSLSCLVNLARVCDIAVAYSPNTTLTWYMMQAKTSSPQVCRQRSPCHKYRRLYLAPFHIAISYRSDQLNRDSSPFLEHISVTLSWNMHEKYWSQSRPASFHLSTLSSCMC